MNDFNDQEPLKATRVRRAPLLSSSDSPQSQFKSPVRRRADATTAVLHHRMETVGVVSPREISPCETSSSAKPLPPLSASSRCGGSGTSRAPATKSAATVRGIATYFRELFLRLRRLLWTIYRRSQLLRRMDTTSPSVMAAFHAGASRWRRHRREPAVVTSTAVLIAALLWFLLIIALAGPPGRPKGSKRGNEAYPQYYRRISGIGVGPSLSDPWIVDEIRLAGSGWDLRGLTDVGGGTMLRETRGSMTWEGVNSVRGMKGNETNSESTLSPSGWDVRANRIETGPLAMDNDSLPKADLLITIFSGTQPTDATKRDLLRQIYDKYEGWVTIGGNSTSLKAFKDIPRTEFTLRIVFVISSTTSPPEGELIGDVLYVPVPEGYHNIVLKTKAMLCLVRYFDFKYLLKADDDSFVCPKRIAAMLYSLPTEVQHKVYAGVPTACNVPTNPDYWNGRVMNDPKNKWYDRKFLHHSIGSLDCYPVYMQGAFYILSQPLVEHLYRGHEHLECFTNEDVTIGSWLLGVDRELIEMGNLHTSHLWDCLCARPQLTLETQQTQTFYHNCKMTSQLKLCGARLLRPGIGC